MPSLKMFDGSRTLIYQTTCNPPHYAWKIRSDDLAYLLSHVEATALDKGDDAVSRVRAAVARLAAANALPWMKTVTPWEEFVALCLEPPPLKDDRLGPLERFQTDLSSLGPAMFTDVGISALTAHGFRFGRYYLAKTRGSWCGKPGTFPRGRLQHFTNNEPWYRVDGENAYLALLENIPDATDREKQRSAIIREIQTDRTSINVRGVLKIMSARRHFDGLRRLWILAVVQTGKQ